MFLIVPSLCSVPIKRLQNTARIIPMNKARAKNPLSRLLIYPDCFISLYLNSGKASPTIDIKANEPHKHLFFFNRKKLEKAMEKELLRVADYSAVDAAIAKANGLEKKDVN